MKPVAQYTQHGCFNVLGMIKNGDYVYADAPLGINNIAAKQYDWVERMGWHNKTVLEALALIASEVGEAVNECRGEAPTQEFGTELADIILRVADLAHWQGIDLAAVIADKMAVNEARGTRGRRI
jgi:NTP pyrophosphatase (non-canonical NTP hydrolase)